MIPETFEFVYEPKQLHSVHRQVAPHILKMFEAQAARQMAKLLVDKRLMGVSFDGRHLKFSCTIIPPARRMDDSKELPEYTPPVGTVTLITNPK